MARYVTSVRTPLPPAEAFAYMADLRNFAEWDPGVRSVAQVEGHGGGPNAVFDVAVAVPGGTATLRYVTELYDATRRVRVEARSRLLTSIDTIDVAPDDAAGSGSIVTYDADLRLNCVLRLADPLLRRAFGRIGDRAAAGLTAALDGAPVPR